MIHFSLFGIPVEIQPWFWVTLAILGGGFGVDSPDALLQVALFVMAGAVSVLVHEFGHALTVRGFGSPVRVVLHAFGGYAAFPNAMIGRGRQFVVAAAGPALQLALGLAAWLVLRQVRLPTPPAFGFVHDLFVISVFWAVLNLVPVIPLDGGQMMESLLGPRRRRLALRVSMIVALGLAVVVFLVLKSILFPVFLALFAWQNHRALQQFR
jgi:Zn-dependent protease